MIKVIVAGVIVLVACDACEPVTITLPNLIPTGTAEDTKAAPPATNPAEKTKTPSPVPAATAEYHLGSGGPLTEVELAQMEAQDPLLKGRMDNIHKWYKWYQDADPNIRPFSPDRREENVLYAYKDELGVEHWLPAWKFETDYPGVILLPPAFTWKGNTPPENETNTGYEIAVGQGLVPISTSVAKDSGLASMGIPVGSQLTVENGTGDFILVWQDHVQGRINEKGVWVRVVDYSQAFGEGKDPQSEADFSKVLKAPGLDDPNRTKWEDGYYTAVDAKLVDYQGPFIKSDVLGGFSPGSRLFDFSLVKLIPISAFGYDWLDSEGIAHTEIVKTFPLLDISTGEKGYFDLTYTSDKGLSYENWSGVIGEYGTPSVETPVQFYYATNEWLNSNAPFASSFLSGGDGRGSDMLRTFISGGGIDPKLKDARFIFNGFRN